MGAQSTNGNQLRTRSVCIACLILAALFTRNGVAAQEHTGRAAPNVLFILADDLGWSDTTLFGTTELYETPNIGRLAKRGMTFRRAYSSSPLCSPTRASILTGLSPATHGITAPQCHLADVRLRPSTAPKAPASKRTLDVQSATRLDTEWTTMAEVFRDAGYKTAHFGKWHLGHEPYSPLQHGFEMDVPHWPGPGPAGSYVAPWKFPDFDPDTPDQHIEDRMAIEAVRFMKENKDRPFFLNYWMFSVHAPFDAKKELIEKYRERIDPENPQRSPTYAAMIESMDDAVGTLLDAVDDLGLSENTIIVFASDNGGNMYNTVDGTTPTSNTPLRGGKATMFEGGVRTPCVVIWPDQVTPGSESDALIQSEDFFPTLLEMVGQPLPGNQPLDGISIVDALHGKPLGREAIFSYFPHGPRVPDNLPPSASVITDDWKLIRVFHGGENYVAGQPGGHEYHLFRLDEDVSESNNLVGQFPLKTLELDAKIERFLAERKAVIPRPNPAFRNRPDAAPVTAVGGLRIARANQVSVRPVDGGLELETTGTDPYIVFAPLEPKGDSGEQAMQWEYFCPAGVKGLQFRSGPPFRNTAKELPEIAPAETWARWAVPISSVAPEALNPRRAKQWRIDWGTRPGVKLRLRNILLREVTEEEKRAEEEARKRRQKKRDDADALSRHFQQDYPASLRSVRRSGNAIVVDGKVPIGERSGSWAVIRRALNEVRMDQPPRAIEAQYDVTAIDRDGAFQVEIPFDESDIYEAVRSGVRFQLIRVLSEDAGGESESHSRVAIASHARYVDLEPSDALRDLEPPPPLCGAKGLTCITPRHSVQFIQELGIKHHSVNVSLVGLIRDDAAPGYVPVTIGGDTLYAHRGRLHHLDQSVSNGASCGAVVAGILLVPTVPGHPLVHPEATKDGVYAMPNLTNRKSIALYQRTLEFLADRYQRADQQFGRVDHWIVHNEVDYGWHWTNMGEQPMTVFMDHYIKSMRLVDLAMRSVNPHARVFISLTHRWNVPDDQPGKTYAPREMLRHLIRSCQREGDFPWGIAYHPYPQSLWNSATWNDKQVQDDLDTRLITIKNLQVLQQFVETDDARQSDGTTRPILLSEQGFHAPVEDPEALERQSAALLYTFRKLRQCPAVLAFDYHRPSDHPGEGGLLLGLRGLPSPGQPIGAAKPAWDVYRDIGTERETERVREFEHHWQSPAKD